MLKEYNDSVQNRFTAYLVAAVRNRKIKYIEQRKRYLLWEEERIEQARNYADFSEQFHSYLNEKTEFLMENWELIEEFMVFIEDKKLAEVLKNLKKRDQRILFARIFGEMNFRELGEMLQMDAKQVEGIYYYVLRKIRRELEARKDEF